MSHARRLVINFATEHDTISETGNEVMRVKADIIPLWTILYTLLRQQPTTGPKHPYIEEY
jgi:hypothetical protein